MKRDKKVLSIQEACDAMDNRMVSFKRMIHAFTDFEVGLFAGLIMKEMDRRNKINEKMKEEVEEFSTAPQEGVCEVADAVVFLAESESGDTHIYQADSDGVRDLCEKVREETGQSNDV